MLDKKPPMIHSKRLPVSMREEEKEFFQDISACCEAERSLARLYGDRDIAKERCLHVCTQAKRINEDDLTIEIKVFKALADITRLKILKLLTGGEYCIGEIMLALKKPQSSISHNLSVLEDAGLIKERKQGKWCHYSISNVAVMDLINLDWLLKRK